MALTDRIKKNASPCCWMSPGNPGFRPAVLGAVLLGLTACFSLMLVSSCGSRSGIPEVVKTVEERTWLEALGRPLRVGYTLPAEGAISRRDSDPPWARNRPIPTIGMEYMALLGSMADISYELQSYESYAELLGAVRNKEIDVIGEISSNRIKEDSVRFLPPFLELPAVILGHEGSKTDITPEDLQGKRVGVVQGVASSSYLLENYPGIQLKRFPDTAELIIALAYRRVDYAVGDPVSFTALLEEQRIGILRPVGRIGFSYQLGLGVRRDMPLLANLMARVQEEIPPEMQREINRSWLGLEFQSRLTERRFFRLLAGILLLFIGILLFVLLWNRSLSRQVAGKTRELSVQLQEKQEVERKLRLDERRLEALLRLSQMEDSSLEEIGAFALEQMVALTESEVGFIAFFDGQERLEATSFWPDMRTAQRYVREKKNLERAGLWKKVLRKKKSLVENSFTYTESFLKAPAEDDYQLKRILMTPAFAGQVLQIAGGVGNKPIDYNNSDVRQMELVLNSLNRLIREKKYRQGLEDQKVFLEEEVLNRSRELEQTRQDLVESNKMASLGGLVAGVAHEINNPLGVAITAASFLEGISEDLEEEVRKGTLTKSGMDKYVGNSRETARSILLNLNKAAELVRSFKGVAADQAFIERRLFNLHDYLEDVLLSLKPKVKHTSHSLRLDCPEDIDVQGYPGAFMQILTNFVVNSLIHGFENQEGGEILVQVERRGDAEVCLTYSDNGRGMDSETAEKAFNPFFTTRRGRGGTGLGMHLVKNLVEEQLFGSLKMRTEPGQGIEIRIVFPLKAPAESLSEKSAENPSGSEPS